jgi:hypothetical protein
MVSPAMKGHAVVLEARCKHTSLQKFQEHIYPLKSLRTWRSLVGQLQLEHLQQRFIGNPYLSRAEMDDPSVLTMGPFNLFPDCTCCEAVHKMYICEWCIPGASNRGEWRANCSEYLSNVRTDKYETDQGKTSYVSISILVIDRSK